MNSKLKNLMDKRAFALGDGDDEVVFTVRDCACCAAILVAFVLFFGIVGSLEFYSIL